MSRLADPAHRREARIALAMLPIGAAVLIGATLVFVAVVALAIVTPLFRTSGWGWREAWYALAAAAALRNARAGIEIMSAFDWRPLPAVLLSSAAMAAAWPGWWLD